MPFAIAIDGPAGAGKSTIAKRIAEKKDLIYIDTGAMYRACALKAIRLGLSCSDPENVGKMMKNTRIEFSAGKDGERKIILDGEDVSGLIRSPEVSKGASDISALVPVRLSMAELQREMAKGLNVILDGRDIGTYVLPDAELKIYLTASADERARRRFAEMTGRGGTPVTLEDVRKDIEYRDRNDSRRELAPLRKADDAVEIDTTGSSIDQVVEKIISLMVERCL